MRKRSIDVNNTEMALWTATCLLEGVVWRRAPPLAIKDVDDGIGCELDLGKVIVASRKLL